MVRSKMVCTVCRQNLTNDEVALCIKILGLYGITLYCLGCLATQTNIGASTLRELAVYYKNNGCAVFKQEYVMKGEDSL